MKKLIFLIGTILGSTGLFAQEDSHIGAWKIESGGQTRLLIVTGKHFSETAFKESPAEFIYTRGGSYSVSGNYADFNYEFNTADPGEISRPGSVQITVKGNKMTIGEDVWKREDNGKPGKLAGAWLITGKKTKNGISEIPPGDRRTMKILSGKYFQWIAYTVSTGAFSGTGGGTYTTKDGKYTENIEFFSRDKSRVGASLEFDYKIEDGKWHHSGFSSKGDPLYEIWSTRKDVGL